MSKTIQLVSPVNGDVYAKREIIEDKVLDAAVAKSRRAQPEWHALSLAKRIEICGRMVAALKAMEAETTPELAWQMGRPVRYGGELKVLGERFEYMSEIAERALAPLVVQNSSTVRRYIERAPHGIALVIAPWNYPFLTAGNAIFPALISGNTVLLKHASQTLLVGERFQQAADQAGLPEGIFQNLLLSHEQTELLLRERLVDFANFTGSVPGGRNIERAASGSFIQLGLELGGKDPAYVMEDADIEKSAESLVDGAFYNSGQCCCGIERIYVAQSKFDQFVEKAVSIAKNYVLGDPLKPETTLGPMAQARYADIVRNQIKEAVAGGAKALIDPKLFPAHQEKGPYHMPQIMIGVDHSMDVMREENFGPLVGIMPVKDDAEAARLMNDSHYGLTASFWTQDMERANKIGMKLDTGTIFMNRCDYVDPALCWTGCKETGRGVTMSEIGYHQLTRPKSYHLRQI